MMLEVAVGSKLERGYRTKLVLFALVASHLQEEKSILRVYFSLSAACLLAALTVFPHSSRAQESPYIVTYNHYLKKPGSLKVESFSTFGTHLAANDFHPFSLNLSNEPPALSSTTL